MSERPIPTTPNPGLPEKRAEAEPFWHGWEGVAMRIISGAAVVMGVIVGCGIVGAIAVGLWRSGLVVTALVVGGAATAWLAGGWIINRENRNWRDS